MTIDELKKNAPDHIPDQSIWNKISRFAKQAGAKTVYAVLLMFYAYKRKDTPQWAKRIILGALAYFISPLDFLPDLTPFLGYTDDLGVLSMGLVTVAAYVNDEVKSKAKNTLQTWFKQVDEKDIEEIDQKLNQ